MIKCSLSCKQFTTRAAVAFDFLREIESSFFSRWNCTLTIIGCRISCVQDIRREGSANGVQQWVWYRYTTNHSARGRGGLPCELLCFVQKLVNPLFQNGLNVAYNEIVKCSLCIQKFMQLSHFSRILQTLGVRLNVRFCSREVWDHPNSLRSLIELSTKLSFLLRA